MDSMMFQQRFVLEVLNCVHLSCLLELFGPAAISDNQGYRAGTVLEAL